MRVVAASDWRDGLAFETPFILAEVLPGDPARCVACGADAEPLPRPELWAYKHRHPKNHDGFVRFYCAAHVPAAKRAAPAASRGPAPRRAAPKRTPAAPERPAPLCPDCFVEVPGTGVCGMCGATVTATS
ncbi:MAG: glucose-6-phosphate dehydrogenase [Microbacterium sp.]|uniref:glucose-6-phosphate dehydrogenase n=1 Tax=Microbacterium sp. TaxID=51671 RepID=UPI003A84B5B5